MTVGERRDFQAAETKMSLNDPVKSCQHDLHWTFQKKEGLILNVHWY